MAVLSRRTLLQASALGLLASVGAPILRRARANGAGTPRVVIVVEGNCFYPRAVTSVAAKAAIEQAAGRSVGDDFFFSRSYEHDSPLVITGDPLATPAGSLGPLASGGPSLVSKSAVVLGLSNTVAGGGHSTFQGGLSCARGDEHATAAITIDALLAGRLGTTTPFDAVRLGTAERNELAYNLCAQGPGHPVPITVNPVDAYHALFAAIVGGSNQAALDERARMLTFAREDVVSAISNFHGPIEQRLKLERYREAIDQSQARQARLAQMRGSVLPFVPAGPDSDARYTDADPLTRLEVQFELATAVLLGGLSNVVVLASGPGGGLGLVYRKVLARHFSGSEAEMQRHALQHGLYGSDAYGQAILDVSAEHVKMIAKMARALDAKSEGDGTVLDNTVIVYMSDNGEQHHSTAEEWPMLLVGGRKLGFQTDGRTVVYPRLGRGNHRQVSNLFNTLSHATGDTSLNDFGAEGASRIATGPLGAELWRPPA